MCAVHRTLTGSVVLNALQFEGIDWHVVPSAQVSLLQQYCLPGDTSSWCGQHCMLSVEHDY
jgi:hypothetical protein